MVTWSTWRLRSHHLLQVSKAEHKLQYFLLHGIHLLSIGWFGGMLLATDLRLLGWVMRGRPVSDLVGQFAPWKRIGFVVVVVTGVLLAWCEPIRLYRSPSFWIKMALFALVGVHSLVFRNGVYRPPSKLDAGITTQAKVAAVLSMAPLDGPDRGRPLHRLR
jgi:hypothetical protein